MKYLFIIGSQNDFDNEQFRAFLSTIMELEGKKPFQMFLYKFNEEILTTEFPYIHNSGDKKKALGLYPYFFLKCIDL